jgi:hypothetical protein
VVRRVRDGAVDTARVKMPDGKYTAAANGQEVKDSIQEFIEQWMGSEKCFWFHFADSKLRGIESRVVGQEHLIARDSEDGRQFRWRLVRGELTAIDLESIPREFHRLLQCLWIGKDSKGKTLGAQHYTNIGLMKPIIWSDWECFWRGVKGGTRGGHSQLHCTRMKALLATWKPSAKEKGGSRRGRKKCAVKSGLEEEDDRERCLTMHVMESIMLLVNAARVGQFFYSAWKKELLYTFMKVPGAVGLENSRPVGMLEILLKCTLEFDYSGISGVWERVGALDSAQYAFREDKGVEGPLMLWALMNEQAYRVKEDQARGQYDLQHAFDGVYWWAVEMVLMIKGLEDDYLDYQAKLIRDTETAVITPFGITEFFRRLAGLPQGGTHSPALFNGFMVIMPKMQKALAIEKGACIPDQYGNMIELLVQIYCDDSHKSSGGPNCVVGLEEWFRIAALWGSFFGMVHKVSKCSAAVARWTKETNADNRTIELISQRSEENKVWLHDSHTGKSDLMAMIDAHDDSRALGVQLSIAGYIEDVEKLAMRELLVTTRAIEKAPAIRQLALNVADSIAWSKLSYRVKLISAWPHRVEKMCAPLRRVVLRKLGLQGAARAVVDTMLWIKGGIELEMERIVQLHTMLNSEGDVQRGLEGSIQELQKYAGIEQPVLESKVMKCHCMEMGYALRECTVASSYRCKTALGWNGSWVGMILYSLSNSKISITGGLGLPKLREGDRNLVEMAGCCLWADLQALRWQVR